MVQSVFRMTANSRQKRDPSLALRQCTSNGDYFWHRASIAVTAATESHPLQFR